MSSTDDPAGHIEDEENGLTLDEGEASELQQVFSTIFPQYLVPLEEIVNQLVEGNSSTEVIEGLRGTVTPLLSAAETIGVTAIKKILEEMQAITAEVAADGINEEQRNRVVDIFYRLKEAVLGLGGEEAAERSAKPPSDFVAKLSQIDGVGGSEVQKILAAGITSRDLVAQANVDEIAAVTGMSMEVARRIHAAFGGRPRPNARQPATPRSRLPRNTSGKPDPPPDSEHLMQEGRVALVAMLRERLRLAEELAQHEASTASSRGAADEQQMALRELGRQLRNHRASLAQERARLDQCEAELARVRGQYKQEAGGASGAPNAGYAADLQEVQRRLDYLRRRVIRRLR